MDNVNVNESLPFLDALGYGGQMFLIGIITVFAVLGVIFLCLLIFKYAFAKVGGKETKSESKPIIPVASAPVSATLNGEIVAVIAAAIARAEEECGDGTKFRVVSFRRK